MGIIDIFRNVSITPRNVPQQLHGRRVHSPTLGYWIAKHYCLLCGCDLCAVLVMWHFTGVNILNKFEDHMAIFQVISWSNLVRN